MLSLETNTGVTEVVIVVVVLAVYLAILGFAIYVYARIIGKAGYSRWWVLAGIVPILNLVMLVMFAFKEWPIEAELRMARGGYGGGLPSGYGGPAGHGGPAAYGLPGSYGAPGDDGAGRH